MTTINRFYFLALLASGTTLFFSASGYANDVITFSSHVENISVSQSETRFEIDFVEVGEPCPGMGSLVYAPLRNDNAEKFLIQKLAAAFNQDKPAHVSVEATEIGCVLVGVK